MEPIQRTIEVERLVNLAKGFGWTLVATSVEGNTVKVQLSKDLPSVATPAA